MSLKLIEVLVLLAALVLFVWWQLRDIRLARARAARAQQPAIDPPQRDSAPEP